MYDYIRGNVVSAVPPYIVLEVQGIGYKLQAPLSLFGRIPPKGEPLLLYTSFIVRENAHQLIGFESTEERDLFELLNTVSGIGPKLALALISHLTPTLLKRAVATEDWRAIAVTPGIGKKTAERLILEVKDRLGCGLPESPLGDTGMINDAVNALIHLGYSPKISRQSVERALTQQPSLADLSALITSALHSTSE